MSTETMLHFLENCTPEGRISFRVASQCAPVLKNLKVSNLITTSPGEWQQIRWYLRKSRVVCIPLYRGEKREVLFLYRCEKMRELLAQKNVQRFLARYGYEVFDLASVVKRLRLRYHQYAAGSAEFPHELGALLEYPLEDVEGFIKNRGENSLLTRYWKVYHDPQKAAQKFRAYDEAKEQAMTEIVNGSRLDQVAL